MNSYEEKLNEVTSHTYVTDSGPILEFIRLLAVDGELGNISIFTQEYIKKVPSSKSYIISSLPAIILNSYICNHVQICFDEFLEWSASDSTWANEIQNSALDSNKFVDVISNILTRIRLHNSVFPVN